jgi:uncharacterized protein YbaA (DUF1428 family)
MSEENRQLYYYHGDHLGSAQIVTDPEGEIYEQLEYTPYGELWVEHVPIVEATPFRFTGKERDSETGLYYFGARRSGSQASSDYRIKLTIFEDPKLERRRGSTSVILDGGDLI